MKEDQLQSISLFADLSSKERRTIAQHLKTETYSRDEIIFSKGNTSNALYIVEEGRISLSVDGKNTLANLGPGSLLGESDFFQGVDRTLTAKATSETTVQVLDDSALDAIIKNSPHLGLSLSQALGSPIVQMTEHLAKQLGNASFTKTLSSDERQLIARQLVAKEYKSDEAIFRNNTPASGLYLVESGLVRLMGDSDADYSELGEGEIFGEMSLISGKAHADTAQAAQSTVVWQLTPEDFSDIAQNNPDIKASLSRSITARLSQSEQARAIEVLRQIPLFQNLNDDALADCAGYLMLRHIPAQQNTFQIGDHGDAMFIVESGQIDLYDDTESLTATASEGSFFGEMALMTGKSRTETARAISDSNLWALYRPDFDALLVKHPQLSVALSQALRDQLSATNDQFIEKHLRKLAVMGGLSRRQLDEISARLRARRFNTGDLIFQEGQPGDELFFIENGYVERFTSTPSGVIPLPVLSTGDFIGETALLSSRPHSTTVRAQTDIDVWALAKADFDELVYKYPNLSQALNRAMSDRLVETMELIRTGGTPPQPAIDAPRSTGHRAAPQRRTAAVPPVPVRPVAPPPLPFSASRPVTGRQSAPQSRQSRAARNTGANRASSSRVSNAQRRQASKAARPKKKSAAKSQAKMSQSSALNRSSKRSQPGAADSIALGAKKASKKVGRRVDGVSRWYANMSLGSRVGLGILILLIVWMACIVPSASIIQALAASLLDENAPTAAAFAEGNIPTDSINRSLEGDLIAALPFVETTTPTPTTTPSPSPTTTASATVTQTPIPTFTPTATFTPTPEDTPTITPTPTPTDTPTATATNTPAYHPPTNTPVPTATATPDADYIVTKVRKLTACENGGNHHIYLHVVDINGNGLNDIPVRISWGTNENDGVTAHTEAKDKGDGYIEFAMFKGTYSVQILGAKSQVASGITPDYQVDETCDITGSTVGNSLYHASFEVVFQRMW